MSPKVRRAVTLLVLAATVAAVLIAALAGR
jgi:hypothetical protein